MKYEVTDRTWSQEHPIHSAHATYSEASAVAKALNKKEHGGRKVYKIREKLKYDEFHRHRAEVYHFRFETTGWAIFTICETTGELNVQSDWGDYCHMWPARGRGPGSLKAFIARAGGDYLADKLFYGKARGERNEFSRELSRNAIKESIIEDRKNAKLDRDEARELWRQTEDLTDDDTAETFRMALNDTDELMDYLGGEWYEYLREEPTGRFLFIRDTLMPFFSKWLRDHNIVDGRHSL